MNASPIRHRTAVFLREWWRRVPEPRVISAITTMLYMVILATGIATVSAPPRSLLGVFGEATMSLLGWLFVVGALVGMIGCALDFWQLERVGIAFMLLGLLAYGTIVGILQQITDGSRLTQLGVIIAAAFGLVFRFALIWRYPFKPDTGSVEVARDDRN